MQMQKKQNKKTPSTFESADLEHFHVQIKPTPLTYIITVMIFFF